MIKNYKSLLLLILTVFIAYSMPVNAKKEDIKSAEKQIEEHKDEITRVIESGIEENQYLTLDNCLKIAISNNPTIKAAISNTEAFQNRIGMAKADYFPRFNISNGYSVTNPNTITTSLDNNTNTFSIVNIGITQLIYDFGKTTTNIDIQKTHFNATEADLRTVINDIVFNVKQSYFKLLLAFHKQEVIKEAVDKYKKHLEQTKAFYEIGTKPKIDMMTAEVNLSNAELELIKAKNNVSIAFASLNNVMGLPKSPFYNLKDQLTYTEHDFELEELIKTAYENRPDYKSAALKVEASKKEIRLAKKDYLPSLEGFSGFNLKHLDTSTDSKIDEGWNAGIALDLPVLNAYHTKKKVNEARALYEKECSEAQSLQNDLYFQVKQTYINFIEAKNTIPATEIALKQAEESYNLARGRYEVGVGNPIELKDAELTHRNAKLAYYTALYDYNTALARLEKVIGVKI
ncbi:MAG TPA: TolC family protein [Candidatus Gastranaerophilales bacterium]|nr:TolC family protein [Candidatus Gastranaerophilales bacterium]